MAQKKTAKEQEPVEEPAHDETMHSGLLELSRKILLASIGAAVVAEEEITGFVNKLVERGEVAEKDARKMVREVLERRQKVERERKIEVEHDRPPALATKADIAALNARLNELAQQIKAMKKD